MRYITLGKEKLDKELFNNDLTNMLINKPIGGLWASPYTPDDDFVSEWQGYAQSMLHADTDNGVIFELKEGSEVYFIDGYNDLKELFENYELENDYNFKALKLIDFFKVATEYDAIRLTVRGQIETRFSIPSLYGWDVDTLLVLNYDCIDETKTETYKRQVG